MGGRVGYLNSRPQEDKNPSLGASPLGRDFYPLSGGILVTRPSAHAGSRGTRRVVGCVNFDGSVRILAENGQKF